MLYTNIGTLSLGANSILSVRHQPVSLFPQGESDQNQINKLKRGSRRRSYDKSINRLPAFLAAS